MKKVKIIIICLIALVVIGGLAFVIIKNINTEDKQTLDVSITDEQGKEAELNLNSDKILVIYFSETGNTQKLAKLISDKVGGDFVRISGTYEDIQKLEPKAKVLEGLPIRGGDMTSDQSNKVDNWLKNLDI